MDSQNESPWLKTLRGEQREVAEALGIKLPTYQSWEQGRKPTIRLWSRVIDWIRS